MAAASRGAAAAAAGRRSIFYSEPFFGSDCTNRLGHGDEWPRWKPTQVAALAAARVSFVACGPASSAAIDASGQLHLWGDNFCGQLFPRVGRPDATDAGLEVMVVVMVVVVVDVMVGMKVMIGVEGGLGKL
jgi:hypothetical protein